MSGTTPDHAFLANTPALAPPPGEVSNLANPPRPMLHISVVAYCICIPLVIAAASVRMFTKAYVMKSIQYEDYAIIAALLGTIAFCGVTIDALAAGAGLHQWNISLLGFMRLGMAASMVFGPAMFFAKLCVLWPMLRIFSPLKTGPIFWLTNALICANFLFYVTGSLTVLFQCRPRQKIWNPFVAGSCGVDGYALFIASTAFNALSDLLMLALPLYSIWHLKMAIKRKIGVSIVFTTGFLALIISVVRLTYSIPFLRSHDTSFILCQVGLWTLAELTTIILCGCMPILPRFVRFLVHSRSGTSASQGYIRTILLSNRKRSGDSGSSRWYRAGSDTRALTQTCVSPDERLAFEHTRYGPPEDAMTERLEDEEALAGGDKRVDGKITKTVHMETRRED